MSQPETSPTSSRFDVWAYLELIRLPAVFTAMADVMLGFLFTHAALEPRYTFFFLLGASTLLYLAGMVLNDVFDLEQDARERPERPLPSGRISPATARWLGTELLLVGILLGWGASWMSGQLRPGIVASLLGGAVLFYDAWLKRTPLGPLGMGLCRFLNVLLGMSVAADPWRSTHWLIAAGIGIYIAGVTWFARTEARESNRWQLVLGIGVMLAGVGLLAWYPKWVPADLADVSWPRHVDPNRWYLMWGVLALLTTWRCMWAVTDPVPERVQMAVKQCLLSLIMLDAVVCFSARGPTWAIVILLLIFPTMMLGRRVSAT